MNAAKSKSPASDKGTAQRKKRGGVGRKPRSVAQRSTADFIAQRQVAEEAAQAAKEEQTPQSSVQEQQASQTMPEEKAAQKTMDEPAQQMEEEAAQVAEEEPAQAAEEEPAQQMEEEAAQTAEEEPAQQVEEEAAQAAEEEPAQQVEEDNISASQTMENEAKETKAKASAAQNRSLPMGRPIPKKVRSKMENAFQADFSSVSIVSNSPLATEMNAKAFARGHEIHFAPGYFKPDSKAGQELLGHELSHIVQQRLGRVKPNTVVNGHAVNNDPSLEAQAETQGKKAAAGKLANDRPVPNKDVRGPAQTKQMASQAEASTAEEKEKSDIPAEVLDLTHGVIEPPPALVDYLADGEAKKVNAKIGSIAEGEIRIRQVAAASDSAKAQYALADQHQFLYYKAGDVANFFAKIDGLPVIALRNAEGGGIKSFMSAYLKETVLSKPTSVFSKVKVMTDKLGMLGVSSLNIPESSIENEVVGGSLKFMAPELSTTLGGFMTAKGRFGIEADRIVFELTADVNFKGLTNGQLSIKRDKAGKIFGAGTIETGIGNASGSVTVNYNDGVITGTGKASFNSERFTGSITLILDEEEKANEAIQQGLGIDKLTPGKNKPTTGKKSDKEKPVVAGFGEGEFTLTSWLSAKVMVGVDSQGYITVQGELVFPEAIEIMEQDDKRLDLFKLSLDAGYGVPLVGQVGIFFALAMYMKYGFGPLVLRNAKVEGTYSTDPNVAQNFSITGALNIGAYAKLVLEVSAGVFVTLLGHRIDAGVKLTAAAGVRAYADAEARFDYVEQDQDGQKVGEAWLSGHFEAAGQLFLELVGSFFVELDSPWWSPAPDKTWDWPFAEKIIPIEGAEFGIGADIEWLVGSPQLPELKFDPVAFDGEKFLTDMNKDPKNVGEKGKGGEEEKTGDWTDKSGGSKDKSTDPKVESGGGKPEKEDLSKLGDAERFTRSVGAVSDVAKASEKKPLTKKELDKKLKKIQDKFTVNQISLRDPKEKSAKVFVKHKDKKNNKSLDNSENLLEVKLISEAERKRQLEELKKQAKTMLAGKEDKENGGYAKGDVEAVAKKLDARSELISDAEVKEGSHRIVADTGEKDGVEILKVEAKGGEKNNGKFPIKTTSTRVEHFEDYSEAFPLTANRKGSARTVNIPGWDHASSINMTYGKDKKGVSGRKGPWVKGHKISHLLGGMGNNKNNLFIITRVANDAMSVIEKSANKDLNNFVKNINQRSAEEQQKVFFYRSKFKMHGSEHPNTGFAHKIKIQYGKMDLSKGSVVIIDSKDISSPRPPSEVVAPIYNINSTGWESFYKMTKGRGILASFAQDLMHIRQENQGGEYENYPDIKTRVKLLHKKMVSKEKVADQLEILRTKILLSGSNSLDFKKE